MTPGSKRKILILSFSPIRRDARVLKQVEYFAEEFEVVTCGYEGAPLGVAEHIEIPASLSATELDGRLITLRLYRRAYWSLPAVVWVLKTLRSRQFDAIIANDLEAVPIAVSEGQNAPVLADLHEYTPLLGEENDAWKRRLSPFYLWLARRYLPHADAWSTVSEGLRREFRDQCGVDAQLVTNAAPFHDIEPTPTGFPLRLVHSGACLRNRQLMTMIDAVERSRANITLDFYLTPNHPDYLDELRARADSVPGVTVNPAVPYAELIDTLNRYDAGVHLLPPTNFNNRNALPNKLFDFVQARLGIVIGPTPEMADYVTRYGLGAVAIDFTAEALADCLDALTPADVAAMKQASHHNARALSAEAQVKMWGAQVRTLLESNGVNQ